MILRTIPTGAPRALLGFLLGSAAMLLVFALCLVVQQALAQLITGASVSPDKAWLTFGAYLTGLAGLFGAWVGTWPPPAEMSPQRTPCEAWVGSSAVPRQILVCARTLPVPGEAARYLVALTPRPAGETQDLCWVELSNRDGKYYVSYC